MTPKLVQFPSCNADEAIRCVMAPAIAAQKQSLEDLEAWQGKQNGSLGRIEGKVDSLIRWMMAALFTALLAAIGWVVMLLRAKG